jgi:hypothetical protein
MERDGLALTLIMITELQRPEVPQAATDAYAVTRGCTARSSRIGETCKGDPSLTLYQAPVQAQRIKEKHETVKRSN